MVYVNRHRGGRTTAFLEANVLRFYSLPCPSCQPPRSPFQDGTLPAPASVFVLLAFHLGRLKQFRFLTLGGSFLQALRSHTLMQASQIDLETYHHQNKYARASVYKTANTLRFCRQPNICQERTTYRSYEHLARADGSSFSSSILLPASHSGPLEAFVKPMRTSATGIIVQMLVIGLCLYCNWSC